MLTHREYMRRMREITMRWSKRYADAIPNEYPAGSEPHDGQTSDYAEHHATFGAPPHYLDLLEERLAELDKEWAASPEAQGGSDA